MFMCDEHTNTLAFFICSNYTTCSKINQAFGAVFFVMIASISAISLGFNPLNSR